MVAVAVAMGQSLPTAATTATPAACGNTRQQFCSYSYSRVLQDLSQFLKVLPKELKTCPTHFWEAKFA
ncbi:hypothetical protein ACLKA7_010427 [Drosophila subpalustris]